MNKQKSFGESIEQALTSNGHLRTFLALGRIPEKELSIVRRDKLTERERRVINLRFPAKDRNPVSFKKLSERFGITEASVRAIESAALDKIREFLDCYY